jgi:hypothetical protein
MQKNLADCEAQKIKATQKSTKDYNVLLMKHNELTESYKRIPEMFKLDSDGINAQIQQNLKVLEEKKSKAEADIREKKDEYNKTIEA